MKDEWSSLYLGVVNSSFLLRRASIPFCTEIDDGTETLQLPFGAPLFCERFQYIDKYLGALVKGHSARI